MDDNQGIEKQVKELESELEETRSLSAARSKLLEANLKELNDIYNVLREKLGDLRSRDRRIKTFQDELVRANKLSELGVLAGSIAHEIKNPLISIQGFARRISTTTEREKINRYAQFIEKEAERLSNVLTKLLEFSRMKEPKKEWVDLNEIVDDTILFMEHHLTRFKNVELVVEKTPDLPLVEVEKIHIQQTLVNIIMNGVQAMPSGGRISISTGREENRVFIAITDNGTGIKEEELDRIFEPFFTTKEKGEGTGLGLSLCKKLIEANNGTIEVESIVGKGSTFRLLIPSTRS